MYPFFIVSYAILCVQVLSLKITLGNNVHCVIMDVSLNSPTGMFKVARTHQLLTTELNLNGLFPSLDETITFRDPFLDLYRDYRRYSTLLAARAGLSEGARAMKPRHQLSQRGGQ